MSMSVTQGAVVAGTVAGISATGWSMADGGLGETGGTALGAAGAVGVGAGVTHRISRIGGLTAPTFGTLYHGRPTPGLWPRAGSVGFGAMAAGGLFLASEALRPAMSGRTKSEPYHLDRLPLAVGIGSVVLGAGLVAASAKGHRAGVSKALDAIWENRRGAIEF